MESLASIVRNFNPPAGFNTPPGWLQGRTIYGGLSAALSLQAALREAPPSLPPLKAAQISFVGPASGALSFKTQVLRQGKSASSIAVDCLAGPDLAMRAAFLFATPRPTRIQHDLTTFPTVPPPDACASLGNVSQAPVHLANFDIRLVGSSLPVSGSNHPELVGWVRHLDAGAVDAAVALMALGDALPPAAMATFTEFVPVSSMTWTLDLPEPAQPGEWFLLRSISHRAGSGYSFQSMDVWSESGRLVLSGTQTIAVFG